VVRQLGVDQDRGQDGGQHRGELISLTRGTRDNIKRKMIVDRFPHLKVLNSGLRAERIQVRLAQQRGETGEEVRRCRNSLEISCQLQLSLSCLPTPSMTGDEEMGWVLKKTDLEKTKHFIPTITHILKLYPILDLQLHF
jgi:hypothetical protein